MDNIEIIKALTDNYIYLIRYDSKVIAVDPGTSEPVLEFINKEKLELSHILITHNHFDHAGGTQELQRSTGCEIVNNGKNEEITIGPHDVNVIETPGHTPDSVCYYFKSGLVFTGDTMFIGGCGRLFGGTASQMWESLCRIASLPDDTLVYPGHEYTVENYQFSLTIEPDNDLVKERLKWCEERIAEGFPTIPLYIREAKETNIFLRADSEKIREILKMKSAPPSEVFAELRRRKDRF